jgi:hypothetical protein
MTTGHDHFTHYTTLFLPLQAQKHKFTQIYDKCHIFITITQLFGGGMSKCQKKRRREVSKFYQVGNKTA